MNWQDQVSHTPRRATEDSATRLKRCTVPEVMLYRIVKLPSLTSEILGLATLQILLRALLVAGFVTRQVCALSLAVLLVIALQLLPPSPEICIDRLPEMLLDIH